MSHRAYSVSESDSEGENLYCIFLHIVEGIGLNRKDGINDYYDRQKDKVVLIASLNGVKFEVEGHATETATIFNSNCIWECEIGDVKRMKTDNRPVKMECFMKTSRSGNSSRRAIGTLLLPLRGVQVVNGTSRDTQFKLHWHKLGTLHSDWRPNKPEIYLLLTIAKKSLVESGQLENILGRKKLSSQETTSHDSPSANVSETALMLQSQNNVYVQLLEQLGVIQVGNNPDHDCDIFNVTLTLRELKHVAKLIELERNYSRQLNTLIFQYDFLGSVSTLEVTLNASDSYEINEKISLNFKTSLKSLRVYFQRIFYLPVNLYWNGIALANYRLDFAKLLPADDFFGSNKLWSMQSNFCFDRLHKILSPRAPRPSVGFLFSVQLVNSFAGRTIAPPSPAPPPPPFETIPLNETYLPARTNIDEGAAGDGTYDACCRKLDVIAVQAMPHSPRCTATYDNSVCSFYELNYFTTNREVLFIKSDRSSGGGGGGGGGGCSSGGRSDDRPGLPFQTEELLKCEEQRPVERGGVRDCCVGTTDDARLEAAQTEAAVHAAESAKHLEPETPTSADTRRSVGVNTEQVPTKATAATTPPPPTGAVEGSATTTTDEHTYRIVQELEEWKAQQIEHFLSELERKEAEYLERVNDTISAERAVLQAKLEAKIAECKHLETELHRVQTDLAAQQHQHKDNQVVAELVKQDIESLYAQRFKILEQHMQRMMKEMEQKKTAFSVEQDAVKVANGRLEQEKSELRERIEQLERQLAGVQQTHVSAGELKRIMSDVRQQSERFTEMEQSKQHYKDEWAKSTRELHKLKLQLLEQQQQVLTQRRQKSGGLAGNVEICLEDILNEEQDALQDDRCELKDIKEMLYLSSDEASSTSALGQYKD